MNAPLTFLSPLESWLLDISSSLSFFITVSESPSPFSLLDLICSFVSACLEPISLISPFALSLFKFFFGFVFFFFLSSSVSSFISVNSSPLSFSFSFILPLDSAPLAVWSFSHLTIVASLTLEFNPLSAFSIFISFDVGLPALSRFSLWFSWESCSDFARFTTLA